MQKSISTAALRDVRSILICQLRQIGDVLLCTPSVRLLAEAFPQAELHLFTEAKCEPVVRHNPRLTKIWSIDKKELTSLPRELAFYWRVARAGDNGKGHDLVVDFQQLPRCRWVVAFSGARIRLSYPPPWYNRMLYTHWQMPKEGYAAMAKASVLAHLGLEWSGERPELYLLQEEREEARRLLQALGFQEGRMLISVDPTHRRSSRAWPPEYWGRLLHLLAADVPQADFLLLYGPGEREAVAGVRDAALAAGTAAGRLLLPPDVLSLRGMAAAVGEARLHIGNCSAPRHIAVALGVPTFTVLGATSRSWTFPAPEHDQLALMDITPLECQPCNRNSCTLYERPRCLWELTPEMVAPRLLAHLQATDAY